MKLNLTGKSLPLAICAAAALAFVPAISNAGTILTFDFTSDHCTGGCLTGQTNGGTITVTDDGTGTLAFNVQLANGNLFVNTGFDASFGFNLSGITSVTYSGLTPTGVGGFTIPGGNPQAAASLHMDGTGFFEFGLECSGTGGSSPCGSHLQFTIAAAGLDITDLAANAAGQFFAADIISGTTGFTGGIDASTPSSSGPSSSGPSSSGPGLPEPGTLALLGVALAGLTVLRRRGGQKV